MTPRLALAGMTAVLFCGCANGQPISRTAPSTPPLPLQQRESIAPVAAGPAAPERAEHPPARTAPARVAPEPVVARTFPTAAPATAPSVAASASIATSITPPTTAPTLQPPTIQSSVFQAPVVEAPLTLVAQFDAHLLALTRDAPPAHFATSLPADERELIASVIDALARFRASLRQEPGLLSARAAPLVELSEQLNAQAPLSLPTLALCREVKQFGVYDPIEPVRFSAGRDTLVIVYCEVEHFRSHPPAATSDGRWETKLSYEAVLYTDNESAAVPMIAKKPAAIVDRCRNRRRDFFLADRLTLPATLPVGRYLLKVTVVDQLANRVAEKTVPITVTSD